MPPFIQHGAQAGGTLALRPHLPVGLGYTSQKWYGPSVPMGQYVAANISGDMDTFVQFLCRKTTTFDRIAIYNTGAVTVNLRLAIFADDGGGHPGALVVDSGQLTTSGAAGDNAATISQSLTGGSLYWLAVNPASLLAVQALTPSYGLMEGALDFALPAASTFGAAQTNQANSRVYGAFPNPSDAIDTFTSTTPFIRLRAA